MTEIKATRLSKIASDFNVGISTIVDFLKKKGHVIDANPNSKVAPELYAILAKEYSSDITAKKESERINLRSIREKKDPVTIETAVEAQLEEEQDVMPGIMVKDTASGKTTSLTDFPGHHQEFKIVDKIDLNTVSGKKPKQADTPPAAEHAPASAPAEKAPALAPAAKVKAEAKPSAEAPVEAVPQAPVASFVETVGKASDEPAAQKAPAKPKAAAPAAPAEASAPSADTSAAPAPAAELLPDTDMPVVAPPKVVGFIDLDARPAAKPAQKPAVQETASEAPASEAPATPSPAAPASEGVIADVAARTVEAPASDVAAVPQASVPADAAPATESSDAAGASAAASDPGQTVTQNDVRLMGGGIRLEGPKVLGKIELPSVGRRTPVASSDNLSGAKKKRARIDKKLTLPGKPAADGAARKDGAKPADAAARKDKSARKRLTLRTEVSDEDVQKQIKETLSRLTAKGAKSRSAKYRRDKRDFVSARVHQEEEMQAQEVYILKVTEFVSVNELASLMNVPVTDVISTCMNMGLFVSINQRLDAETMALVADEFGYKVEFVSAELQDMIKEEEDSEEDLQSRPPIVTVMGHVDHGKTKLLDFIRHSNVIAGEAGGITQHIGAYGVRLKDGRQITFLDTPGHEAFTAMRARGAKITDVAIIVVAADDGVKPQTVEAINHASAAGVPIVFAINKIDKKEANPEKVKEELANMNYLVEDWGGKYQSQEISAKAGLNVDLLLEKVLLEAELLDLKANPDRRAVGTVVESSLDKGRGYVATILVQNGSLHNGDVLLAGTYVGNIKAMYNERNQRIEEAGPSAPVLVLGLDGAPQAGDTFNVLEDFKEAREIATKRAQLQREQGMRTKKHITLDEIGRRIAIGNFQELNIIVKGDVDGSIEALSDSLIKLSTPEIQVNVIHKAVGQISESDIMLAVASNAIIVGFQVRPSMNARKLAEKEQIDIRLYSIIYNAIEEIKSAMEGMLSPEIKEEIVATLEIREAFKITKVGTVAGCIVREGKITRTTRIRIIRDGIVIYTGELGSLKRFKDDVKEVSSGYECGLNIQNFNDIKVGDIIEGFTEVEVKKTL
jgi:translation initiation factor IF-2